MNNTSDQPLITVSNLHLHFPIPEGTIFRRRVGEIRAVDNVSLAIKTGETLSVVGEDDVGKSSLGRAILQIEPPTAGSVIFEGTELTTLSSAELRLLRRRMQLIFSDPFTSLDPRKTLNRVISEPLEIQGILDQDERAQRVEKLLALVGMNPYFAQRYPHEFSGGQRQRAAIARALATRPDFIVCDEPTAALDPAIGRQILALLGDLQQTLQLTYLLLTRSLAVAATISDRIAIMYLGKIVELAERQTLLERPYHPYTQALVAAEAAGGLAETGSVPGELPSAADPPAGCNFCTRCPDTLRVQRHQGIDCYTVEPELIEVEQGHWVACHLHRPPASR